MRSILELVPPALRPAMESANALRAESAQGILVTQGRPVRMEDGPEENSGLSLQSKLGLRILDYWVTSSLVLSCKYCVCFKKISLTTVVDGLPGVRSGIRASNSHPCDRV